MGAISLESLNIKDYAYEGDDETRSVYVRYVPVMQAEVPARTT